MEEGILHHLDPAEFFLLPNTAGCYTAADAARYARLGRAAGLNDWVKLEVIGDERTLLPDTAATLESAIELVADGFKVMAYTNDDLVTALRLEDAGCVAVMPLASPIGSGLGVVNPYYIREIKRRLSVSGHRGCRGRHGLGRVRDDGAGRGRRADEHGDRGRRGPGRHGPRHETGGAGGPGRVPGRTDGGPRDRRALVPPGRDAGARLTPGRTLAASILAEVESGRRLDVAWEASGASASPERGWIRTLAYGTVRLRGRIDHLLSRFAGRPTGELDPPVLIALRMGAFQILEMGGVPDYAAVSESVEQVKGTRSRAAAGLVNAVLRRVAASPRDKSLFPAPDSDLEGYLTTWGSHPAWLVRRWIEAHGAEVAKALVEADNREPDIYIRPVGMEKGEAVRVLAASGFCAADCTDENGGGRCIRLLPRTDPAEGLELVPGVIQDPAASLVVDYSAPDPGVVVADLCAAPGGKALALSETAGGVVAADLSPRRLGPGGGGSRPAGSAGVAGGRRRALSSAARGRGGGWSMRLAAARERCAGTRTAVGA